MNDYDTPEIRCSLRNLSRVTEWCKQFGSEVVLMLLFYRIVLFLIRLIWLDSKIKHYASDRADVYTILHGWWREEWSVINRVFRRWMYYYVNWSSTVEINKLLSFTFLESCCIWTIVFILLLCNITHCSLLILDLCSNGSVEWIVLHVFKILLYPLL